MSLDGKVSASHSIFLPPAIAPRRKNQIPSGLALSEENKTLYVCGNLANQLLEIDLKSNKVIREFEVGVAPYDVVLHNGKAYVSNWAGRQPLPGDIIGPAGRGTVVKVDPETHIANEGSISVIDLNSGLTKDILVHLHSSALALLPNGRYLVCANAASDNISVIDTHTDMVVETIWVKANPSDLFGASPNAFCFFPDGKNLFAANGTQNAVAVINFDPDDKKSSLLGLIPVEWFPGAITFDAVDQMLYVANIKGHPVEPKEYQPTGSVGFNTHHYFGSISIVPTPSKNELVKLTKAVYANYPKERIVKAFEEARPNQPPVPYRRGSENPVFLNM